MSSAILLAAALAAQVPGPPMSLGDAWRAAQGRDPDILAAEAKRRADREAATQARALSLPKVQAQGDVTVTRTEVDVNLPPDLAPWFGGTQTGGRATTSVQAAMPIYDLGNRADATKLRARAAAGEEQFDGEAQGLILRVAQAYFDVAEGEETVASYAAQFDAYELQRRGAQARFDAGKAKITDVREAEAQRDAAQAQRLVAEAQLAAARATFAELVGRPPLNLAHVRADFAAGAPPVTLDAAMTTAARDAPAVAIARHSARAATADIDRYSVRGRPVVEGIAGYQGQYRLGGSNDAGLLPDTLHAATAGVRLTIPLYAGGGIASKRREAEATAGQKEQELAAAQRDARLQAQRAWYAVSTGAARTDALRTALRSAVLQERAARTGLSVGVRTQTDLLNAQAQLFATRRELSAQIYDYLLAQLQLAAATATLDGGDLERLDTMIAR